MSEPKIGENAKRIIEGLQEAVAIQRDLTPPYREELFWATESGMVRVEELTREQLIDALRWCATKIVTGSP